jgi:hypothetical protein
MIDILSGDGQTSEHHRAGGCIQVGRTGQVRRWSPETRLTGTKPSLGGNRTLHAAALSSSGTRFMATLVP